MRMVITWALGCVSVVALQAGMVSAKGIGPEICERAKLSGETQAYCHRIVGLSDDDLARATAEENARRRGTTTSTDSGKWSAYSWWRRQRERRQAKIDAYLEDNRDDFDSYRTAPLAIKQDVLNFVGIQMIMFRLLTEIFPDIWGPAGERMATVGYGPDPWDPESVMPLGTGYILSEGFEIPDLPVIVRVNYATFTCMGCHSGTVTLEDGSLQRMMGAPNPTSNYFVIVNQTVNHRRYTPENFKTALNSKPLGFVYGDPALLGQEVLERVLFNLPGGAEFFLEELESSRSNHSNVSTRLSARSPTERT